MRRFIVEALVDAVLLAVIIIILNFVTVAQPFPFGPDTAPIVQSRGTGLLGFLSWAVVLVLVNRFARPENRLAFNAVTEIFLAQHLGGRYEAIGGAFKGSTITVPTGAGDVPGLKEKLPNEEKTGGKRD